VRLRTEADSGGVTYFEMRRGTQACSPRVYVDGRYIPGISADEVSTLVPPDQLEGIEIYSMASAPPQFSLGLGTEPCGTILLWSKRSGR
jgi:hypothetical protein